MSDNKEEKKIIMEEDDDDFEEFEDEGRFLLIKITKMCLKI
jgi:hypothetical protein